MNIHPEFLISLVFIALAISAIGAQLIQKYDRDLDLKIRFFLVGWCLLRAVGIFIFAMICFALLKTLTKSNILDYFIESIIKFLGIVVFGSFLKTDLELYGIKKKPEDFFGPAVKVTFLLFICAIIVAPVSFFIVGKLFF